MCIYIHLYMEMKFIFVLWKVSEVCVVLFPSRMIRFYPLVIQGTFKRFFQVGVNPALVLISNQLCADIFLINVAHSELLCHKWLSYGHYFLVKLIHNGNGVGVEQLWMWLPCVAFLLFWATSYSTFFNNCDRDSRLAMHHMPWNLDLRRAKTCFL